MGNRRRVESQRLSLSDLLPLQVPEGLDLLLLQGEARNAEELPALQAHLQAYPGEGPVVVGVPTQAGPKPPYRWLYQGHPLPVPVGNRKRQWGWLLRRIYHDSPRGWRADRATRRKAFEYLLDFGAPIWLPIETPARPERSRSLVHLLQQALVGPGLLHPVQTSGNCQLYEWREGDQSQPEGRLFRELLTRLYRAGSPPTLAELLSWLGEPPRGLRGVSAWLYLTAAMRCHSQDLELVQGQKGVELSRETLLQALRRPSAWRVGYRPAERHEVAFAASVSRLFATDQEPDRALDLWERARADLLAWWRRLPRWTRRHVDGHSPNGLALVRLCEAAPKTPARQLVRDDLPRAYRCAAIPRSEDQSFLLERLESARLELEGHLQGQADRMATRLCALFTGSSSDPPTSWAWLDRGCREWLAGVPLRGELSGWTQGLRAAVLSEGEVSRRWLEELPLRLELPPLGMWDTDNTVVFLARVARARLELELWTVLRTLPLDPRSEVRQAQMGEWIRQTLQSVGVPAARAEKILFDLLEQLYAQETPG